VNARAVVLAYVLTCGPLAAVATAASGLQVGGFSSQSSPTSALVGAHISAGSPVSTHAPGAATGGTGVPPPPTLLASSPLLADASPDGAGSFWYQGAAGEQCIYAPSSSPACFVIVSAPVPTPDLRAAATSLAAELGLSLSPLEASPAASVDGLTGAPSAFWLATPPTTQVLTLTLDGERVTVTAVPGTVSWSFGDGTGEDGGAGVPVHDGAELPDAIMHVYGTRCLPGDSGRDPFVLAGCGPSGYTISASVAWSISFSAVGSVDEDGGLPSRTTLSELSYPVSEASPFLVGGGG